MQDTLDHNHWAMKVEVRVNMAQHLNVNNEIYKVIEMNTDKTHICEQFIGSINANDVKDHKL